MVQNSAPNIVYLDKDSINYHNDSLYYNIKLITNSSGDAGIYSTIQSKGDSAGIVESFKGENYQTHARALTPKTSKQLKPLTEKSLLYSTNKMAYDIYKSRNQIRENDMSSGRPSSASSGSNATDVDFGPYMKELQRRIRMNWEPPKGTENKRVVLLFTIAKDGRLLSCSVAKSSGLKNVDEAALKAVLLTAPFRPLPSDFHKPKVDVEFMFDYNVFKNAQP